MSLYKFWLIYYELKINTCNWKYNSKKLLYYPMHPFYSVFGITHNYPFKIISFFFPTLNSIINVARVNVIHLFLQYPISLICGLQVHAANWGRHFCFFFFFFLIFQSIDVIMCLANKPTSFFLKEKPVSFTLILVDVFIYSSVSIYQKYFYGYWVQLFLGPIGRSLYNKTASTLLSHLHY